LHFLSYPQPSKERPMSFHLPVRSSSKIANPILSSLGLVLLLGVCPSALYAAAPVLSQPANMTVTEGATANQTIVATDADGQPLNFTKVSGPTYLGVTTTTPGTGTATGNIHLTPGFSNAGTAS